MLEATTTQCKRKRQAEPTATASPKLGVLGFEGILKAISVRAYLDRWFWATNARFTGLDSGRWRTTADGPDLPHISLDIMAAKEHAAECHERLLTGDGLDHQIPDCRLDRLWA